MKEVQGAHTGKNQASIMTNIVSDYNITTCLGYFMMDNAFSNDTFIEAVAQYLNNVSILYNAEQKRLCCNGHIINLSVQAFLFGKISPDLEYLEAFNDESSVRIPTTDELDKWRKIGPLGKLHNIIIYITLTPQRKQNFRKLEPHLLPRRDNSTRWNSWFIMLDWAINKLKLTINQFCFEEDELKYDALNANDWRTLESIRDFLRHFHDATKATEGRESTLEHFLPLMEFLICQFEKALDDFSGDDFMIGCLDAGYHKLLKYFNKHERSPAYVAAVVLNLRLKWTIFKKWEEDDRKNAEHALTHLWRSEYRSNTGLPQRVTPTVHSNNSYLHWFATETADDDSYEMDELEKYFLTESSSTIGHTSARE